MNKFHLKHRIWFPLPVYVLIFVCLSVTFVLCVRMGNLVIYESGVVYVSHPWDESMDSKIVKVSQETLGVNYSLIQDDHAHKSWSPDSLDRLLNDYRRGCRRMVSTGGSIRCADCVTCKKDGNKFMCLDEGVAPVPGQCLVYSFGAGGDISWDRKIAAYRCKVFIFDMTMKEWSNMLIEKDVHFLNVGLSSIDYDADLQMGSDENEDKPIDFIKTSFRSIWSIRDILGHTKRPIDILKMDIEHTEWEFFDSIFHNESNRKALEDVKQIAVEIHLDHFKNESAAVRVSSGMYYERILSALEANGFRLVHTELNTSFQVFADVRGKTFPLFRESLYVNEKYIQKGFYNKR